MLIFIAECSEFRKGGRLYFSHMLRDGDYGRALVDVVGIPPQPVGELGEAALPWVNLALYSGELSLS